MNTSHGPLFLSRVRNIENVAFYRFLLFVIFESLFPPFDPKVLILYVEECFGYLASRSRICKNEDVVRNLNVFRRHENQVAEALVLSF